METSGQKNWAKHLYKMKYFPKLTNIFSRSRYSFFYIQDDNKEEHITTYRSEAERVINRTLPVCRPLTEVMSVQHYRSYEAFLLGSRSSLVVFKEKSECT